MASRRSADRDGPLSLQPIHVEDMARLSVEHGESTTTVTMDAVRPEALGFDEPVRPFHRAVGSRAQVTTGENAAAAGRFRQADAAVGRDGRVAAGAHVGRVRWGDRGAAR